MRIVAFAVAAGTLALATSVRAQDAPRPAAPVLPLATAAPTNAPTAAPVRIRTRPARGVLRAAMPVWITSIVIPAATGGLVAGIFGNWEGPNPSAVGAVLWAAPVVGPWIYIGMFGATAGGDMVALSVAFGVLQLIGAGVFTGAWFIREPVLRGERPERSWGVTPSLAVERGGVSFGLRLAEL